MFKNMKIRKKLIIAFIAICIISISSGIVGIILLNITTTQYHNALINYGFSQGYIGKFSTLLNHEGNLLRDLATCQSKVTLEGKESQLNQTIQETNATLTIFKNSSEKTNLQETYENIASLYKNYSEQRDEAIQFAKNGDGAAAQVVINNKVSIPMNMCITVANGLIEKNRVDGLACSDKLDKLSKMTSVIMLLVMLISLLSAVLISIIISKRISKPVVHIKNVAEKLCDGNLDVSINYHSNNEIGQMAKSFSDTIDTLKSYILEISTILNNIAEGNLDVTCVQDYKGDFAAIKISLQRIIGSLNHTFTDINQSAEQVTTGSEQVASGAQSLAQGAAEQASSIEQLSATINDIADKVNLTAKHAEHTNHQIVDVGNAIEASNDDMHNMLSAMSDISESSEQIARIIKTIEDIAFQTNILALNAAVEAARAGSAGKGFAVVAEEVRNLASKSSQAAKNTTELIENSMSAVDKGTKIANQTAHSLSCVVSSAEKAIQLIDEINIACKNESESISQVTRGVDQISSVVQTNSATAEQSAAASDELSKLATGLKSDIAKFKLNNQISADEVTNFDEEQSSECSFDTQKNFAYKY